MSWEAVTWATKQRMKSSHEQLVLLVLANAADPDGVAFARWPGRDHWWKYLVDLTRLSKSTLFRDINTLIDVGLCARSMIVMSDGARRPTIQLNLAASYRFERTDSAENHSHTETGAEEDADDAETSSDISDIEGEDMGSEIHSHTETGPTGGNEASTPADAIPSGGTDPFPVVGMHKDTSNSCSKESPPTPQRGATAVVDNGFEEFRKAWGKPIERLSVAKSVWDRIQTAKHGEAIAGARGYWAWVGKQRKDPVTVSAQTFLRESAGWAQWLIYTPDATGASSISTAYALNSREAKAIMVLHDIGGVGQYLRTIMIRNNAVNYLQPVTRRLLALAEAGGKDGWPVLTHQQAAAWETMVREMIAVQIRKRLSAGDRAPWPWPPSVEGKIYTATTGPPGDPAEMSSAEADEFR